ncbi:MAG: primosomal protein N', partial [Spirochaetaceae bacterium]
MSIEPDPYLEVAFNIPVGDSFTYRAPANSDALVAQGALGLRVVAPFGRRSLAGFVVGSHRSPPAGVAIKEITRFIDTEPLFDARYLELARWVSRLYLCSLGEALAAMLPGGRRETEPPALPVEEAVSAGALQLSDEQRSAVDALCAEGDSAELFYLYGVTGSGKTEVFLQAADRLVAEGRGVIYLVPEIALTHQLIDTIR